ncbi:hypothetical protein [Prevotella sp. HUN102]|uniref:hypothetical protein n=1 Tax=Prevotella sp. HUN102 TaxID=1392486 RepID=UPI00048E8A66|nr:hypothetical protein [Prevotella sp. HUN102]
MVRFIKATYELHFIAVEQQRQIIKRAANDIIDNFNDWTWQNSIYDKLRKVENHNTSLLIVLRLFHQSEIEEGKLKSYTRYIKKKERLVIDQMLALDDYLNLTENEIRQKLCNDICNYVCDMLKKYKDQFCDFDAMSFIPLFKTQMDRI